MNPKGKPQSNDQGKKKNGKKAAEADNADDDDAPLTKKDLEAFMTAWSKGGGGKGKAEKAR